MALRTLRPSSALHLHLRLPTAARRRAFFTLPTPSLPLSPAPQALTASRTLPHAARPLYELIADIDAYASFLPYCTASRVTAWTTPGGGGGGAQGDAGRRWPARGALTVGWGPATVSYVSRVYCTPYSSVEAVSGAPTAAEAARGYGSERDGRIGPAGEAVAGEDDGVFKSLVTRWDVIPGGGPRESGLSTSEGARERTTIKLCIRYQFANPVYQLSAGQFANEVAGKMIEAFEARARKILGSGSARSV